MKCPTCHGTMRAGSATIQRSNLGLLADVLLFDRVGSTAHYLYFHPPGAAEAVQIDHTSRVFCCQKCRTLMIAPKPQTGQDEAIDCMSCGKTIPARAARCTACGWSWGAGAEDPA